MNKIFETLNINFGRKHIASNLNYYRVAKPNENFWEWYKENKEQFKQNKYSVYKHNELGFLIYDWTCKEKATEEEKKKYDEEKEDYEKFRILCTLQDLIGYVENKSNMEVAYCETWEQIIDEVNKFFENPNYVWENYLIPNMKPHFELT